MKEHLGGIYDFLQKKKIDSLNELQKSASLSASPTASAKGNEADSEQPSENKLSYEAQKELNKKIKKLERQVADCEASIEETESAIAILEAKMATPEGASDMQLYERHQKLKQQSAVIVGNEFRLQSYDFYYLFQHYGCNMQFGGDDQWSNMLGGTELIRRKLGKDAYAMTITLLTDSQGKKMGKTAGNAVWLDPNKTSPFEFYQYWRNVGDADVMKCIRMLTFLPLEQIDEMSTWKDQRLNEAKEILAYELTKMVHGEEEAEKAQNAARALFSGAADTEHMPSTQLTEADLTDGSIGILTLMVKAGLAASNGEARRLVVQGGVLVDGEKVGAPTVSFTADQLKNGIVIKKGKKIYHKVTL